MENCLRKFANFVQLVETTLDMHTAQKTSGREILVNSSFDPQFAQMEAEKKQLLAKMHGVLEETKKDLGKFDAKIDVKLVEYPNERDTGRGWNRGLAGELCNQFLGILCAFTAGGEKVGGGGWNMNSDPQFRKCFEVLAAGDFRR